MDEHQFKMPFDEYMPLRDVVFNTLRHAILQGDFHPGERLMELHLAKMLGVSRTPIREAIRKLELEGLVVMIPRKGAEVARITEKHLRDVLEVRKVLEELAVSLACEKITVEQVQALKQLLNNFEGSLLTENLTSIAEADVKFHDGIYEIADNQKLLQILYNLREQMYRYRMEYIKSKKTHEQLISEHKEILASIIAGDKARASDAMKHHIDNQVTAVVNKINE